MLKLYGCGSPNVFKVQLLLAELGLDHAFEFRALNPNGRLPVLVDAERQQVEEEQSPSVAQARLTARFCR